MGRSWESPVGNLYCSTLVRLRPGDPSPPTLALVAAVATWRAIDAAIPGRARIKWPNDIMVGAAKLSGMLLERAGDAVVIGIGVNITAFPERLDRPATSLWALGATEETATSLLDRLAKAFAAELGAWRSVGLAPVRSGWLAAAHPVGTALAVSLPDGTILQGAFSGLDEGGALILALADGATRVIHAGDIFLV